MPQSFCRYRLLHCYADHICNANVKIYRRKYYKTVTNIPFVQSNSFVILSRDLVVLIN